MSPPSYTLEVKAAEERKRIHSSVAELRSRIREKLDVKRTARQYLPYATGAAGLLGLIAGFGFAGIFTRR